jgi:hypothetical protein
VKKILHPLPEKRLSIQNILKHRWFEQNKVNLNISQSPQSKSSPSPKSDQKTSAFGFQDSGFKDYLNQRIAESIMPTNNSPVKETTESKKIVNSTQFSFTPEELANVIRPQSILGNKDVANPGSKNPYMNKASRSQNPYT